MVHKYRILVSVMAFFVLLASAAMTDAYRSNAGAQELKLAHFMSPKHPMHRTIFEPWSKEIAEKSGGKLTVKIFPGGALGKGPRAQYKRAVDGVADVTFGLPGFTPDLFKRTTIIELPGMASDAVDGANKIWDAVDLISPEWKKVKVLALWVNSRQLLISRDKPIRSLADLKGMKIRTPSRVQATMLKELGAIPVPMPINRVYNSLRTGDIDAIMTGPSTIKSFKLHEVGNYFTVGIKWGRSPFFLVMNENSWNGLSAENKKLVEETTGRPMSVKASQFYAKAGKGALKFIKDTAKKEIIVLSDADAKKGEELLGKARTAYLDNLAKQNIPANEIFKAMGSGK